MVAVAEEAVVEWRMPAVGNGEEVVLICGEEHQNYQHFLICFFSSFCDTKS